MKLPHYAFIRLTEDQDEAYSLASSFLKIPIYVETRAGRTKQILIGQAIDELATERVKPKNYDTVLKQLHETLRTLIEPYFAARVKKQFPSYKPILQELEIELVPTKHEILGKIWAYPFRYKSTIMPDKPAVLEYKVGIHIYIKHTSYSSDYSWLFYKPSTALEVRNTLFHELIHLEQAFLTLSDKERDITPPHVKYTEPNPLYDKLANSSLPYQQRPIEIEAFLYQNLYPILNEPSKTFKNGFSVIDRICKNEFFQRKIQVACDYLNNVNGTKQDLRNIDPAFADPYGWQSADLRKHKQANHDSGDVLPYILESIKSFLAGDKEILEMCHKLAKEGIVTNRDRYAELPAEKISPDALKALMTTNQYTIIQTVIDKFMYSNLNTIINQIKTTYKDTIPGLEDLFV